MSELKKRRRRPPMSLFAAIDRMSGRSHERCVAGSLIRKVEITAYDADQCPYTQSIEVLASWSYTLPGPRSGFQPSVRVLYFTRHDGVWVPVKQQHEQIHDALGPMWQEIDQIIEASQSARLAQQVNHADLIVRCSTDGRLK